MPRERTPIINLNIDSKQPPSELTLSPQIKNLPNKPKAEAIARLLISPLISPPKKGPPDITAEIKIKPKTTTKAAQKK